MIEAYVSAWNNNNLEEFKAAFSRCWANSASYTNPNYGINGVDAISELAQESLEKFPGRTFHVLIQPEYHHNWGRYTWQGNLGNETRQGVDIFEYNDAFMITRLVSFF